MSRANGLFRVMIIVYWIMDNWLTCFSSSEAFQIGRRSGTLADWAERKEDGVVRCCDFVHCQSSAEYSVLVSPVSPKTVDAETSFMGAWGNTYTNN